MSHVLPDVIRRTGARHKPGLTRYLQAVGLDVSYHRGQGNVLYYRNGEGDEVEVLDLVGGYGVLLLGHQPPELVAAAVKFFASGCPNHVQGSIRPGAEQLANALSSRLSGEYCAVLANSGTEAVEAALKHAFLETAGRRFIALHGGFHGKTMGALQVTSNRRFREPFGRDDGSVCRVVANDMEQLKATFASTDDLAGLIYEPIQGEAGIRPLTAEFLQVAAALCAERKIPLIADECQTGLGRTGAFTASEQLGVTPDYVIFSKGLGGGIAKLSALLIKRSRYRPEFDLVHSSTFADDEFSCAIALRVLELIDTEAFARCHATGVYLREQLGELQRRYPEAIADVRGHGLMLGVVLRAPGERAGFVLNHLAERDLLGPFVCSYLLREHHIRVATTLSDSMTLRVQPSLFIEREPLDTFIAALADACGKLSRRDLGWLQPFPPDGETSFQPVPTPSSADPPIYHYHRHRLARPFSGGERLEDAFSAKTLRRVAWVFHLIDTTDLGHLDASLARLPAKEKDTFCNGWSTFCEPVVMDPRNIRSGTDELVRLYPILLPVTSQWMLRNALGNGTSAARRLVQKAADVAAAMGCDVLSLGQFTSIVTRRGQSLRTHSMHVTAGSSYTAALVGQAVWAAMKQKSWDPADHVLGVVGAAGDVAKTCAAMMAPSFAQSLLVGSGRAGAGERLRKMAQRIPRARVATRLQDIEQASVVVCATNSTAALIGPECLGARTIVCDASVPANLQPRLSENRPDVTICPGAIAALPHREDLHIPGFPLPLGYTYGCMAEGLLLGFAGKQEGGRSGRPSLRSVRQIVQLASRHGFEHASPSDLSLIAEVVS